MPSTRVEAPNASAVAAKLATKPSTISGGRRGSRLPHEAPSRIGSIGRMHGLATVTSPASSGEGELEHGSLRPGAGYARPCPGGGAADQRNSDVAAQHQLAARPHVHDAAIRLRVLAVVDLALPLRGHASLRAVGARRDSRTPSARSRSGSACRAGRARRPASSRRRRGSSSGWRARARRCRRAPRRRERLRLRGFRVAVTQRPSGLAPAGAGSFGAGGAGSERERAAGEQGETFAWRWTPSTARSGMQPRDGSMKARRRIRGLSRKRLFRTPGCRADAPDTLRYEVAGRPC